MKHQLFAKLTLGLFIGMISACQKEYEIEPPCSEGSNSNIWHQCIMESLDFKGSKTYDINENTELDLLIFIDKYYNRDTIAQNIGYLSLANLNNTDYVFDYYIQEVRNSTAGSYMPKSLAQGFVVDSSLNFWLSKRGFQGSYLPLYSYINSSAQGTVIKEEKGLINIGDFYIAFRYNDQSVYPFGWKNGWMKLNATQDKLIIKEIALHKRPEVSIKVGEK